MIPNHITSSDGLRLHVQHWAAENPRGVVMLAHGLAEHIARYEHVATAFNKAGLAVIGQDHRAHGKSEGEHRGHVPDIGLLVDDLELLWEEIKSAYPDIPHVVMGHSMGGLIALQFTLRRQAEIHALVVTGPALTAGFYVPGFMVGALNPLGKRLPQIHTLAFKAEHISRSAETIYQYDNDPLVERGPVSLGTARSLLMSGQDVLKRANAIRLPIYVAHGGADKIVTPAASKKLFAALASEDKTLQIYPGYHHEILNEPEQDDVIADILQWIEAHLIVRQPG